MNPVLILTNSIVEVLSSPVLKNQPYLIRIDTWGQRIEIRADVEEIKQLADFLDSLVKDPVDN